LGIIFVGLLGLSSYFYALNYIRYGTRFQNKLFFRWLISLANFFYDLALLFPLLTIFIWLADFLVSIIKIPVISPIFAGFPIGVVLGSIGAIIISIVAALISKVQSANYREIRARLFNNQAEYELQLAEKLYKNELYSGYIIEIFKSVEMNLRKKLEEKNFDTKNMNVSSLIRLAISEGILSGQYLAGLNDLRVMRNNAAHGDIKFTKEQTDFAHDLVKNILEEMDNLDHKNNDLDNS
jgi:hypothetical protein